MEIEKGPREDLSSHVSPRLFWNLLVLRNLFLFLFKFLPGFWMNDIAGSLQSCGTSYVRTTQLYKPCIPGPQKLHEIINIIVLTCYTLGNFVTQQ